MSKNPLIVILEPNKLNGNNYNHWPRNLKIILDFEIQTYVLDLSPLASLPDDSSVKERVTFKKWHDNDRKVRSIIPTSMTNELHKQYDRLDHASSIMMRLRDLYTVPDRIYDMPRLKHSLVLRWLKNC
ncbi:UNVERIFIED_CONTAM: hypothetical protein Sangu_2723200 [Sesamum angustifolium]|uniref:Retrotransposon Copia-like N-terminal domain-containing protein n=1 Tax=Sesamum angustifolium TaxID=2727405 RepID=A0AAW2IZ37_9LAMI